MLSHLNGCLTRPFRFWPMCVPRNILTLSLVYRENDFGMLTMDLLKCCSFLRILFFFCTEFAALEADRFLEVNFSFRKGV